MNMSQTQVISGPAQLLSGLGINTAFPTGQLSLHDYRKLLSQQDGLKTPPSPPPRLLKRKQAAVNLHQVQQQYPDFTFPLMSPVSSAPSSPPPLSLSQSVISLHGDLPTPISPASIGRPFSQPLSSVTRRMDPFSARLKKPKHLAPTHSRSSSQLTLPSAGGGGPPLAVVHHNGTDFEILNPKDSLFRFLNESPYRISSHSEENQMDREEDTPDVSPSRHSFVADAIPDDMVRPISASESAVLSRFQQQSPPPPAATGPVRGMPQPQKSFVALPPVAESPAGGSNMRPQSPKPTGMTLRQKVSRLFGGSEVSSSDRRLFHKRETELHHLINSPKKDADRNDDENNLRTPPSEYQHEEPSTPLRRTERPSARYDESPCPSPRKVNAESRALRRRTYGPHSSNRHHTLQDALRQLETENSEFGVQDILRYIGSDDASSHEGTDYSHEEEEAATAAAAAAEEEAVERPWQPDTWHERPPVHVMPHNLNRPSDSNLSTNAPSTRASIRPYVEQAAAFMAGGDRFSLSSSESTAAEKYDDEQDEREDDERAIQGGKHASLASTATDGYQEMAPITPVRRTISRRARPLSSNPPDLDTPLISASPPPSSATTSPASHRGISSAGAGAAGAGADATGIISWSPVIPARHPNHRFVHFEDGDGPGPALRTFSSSSSLPPPPVPPKVVAPVVATRIPKKKKKHVGCPCL